jgi:hypothetical protein
MMEEDARLQPQTLAPGAGDDVIEINKGMLIVTFESLRR